METKRDDWVRYFRAENQPIEAMHAYFRTHRYHPHSHDTYSFGVTERGVQAFRCRGAERASVSGMVIAFNPDDPHDGHAGDAPGFVYRIVHVGPAFVARIFGDALQGGSRQGLPLFRDPVFSDARAEQALSRMFACLFDGGTELERDERLADAILALSQRAGVTRELRTVRESSAARVARAVRAELEDRFASDIDLEALAQSVGCSRYAMYRAFVARYGMAPSDYQRQCRLRAARRLLREGGSLAQAAVQSGFADQSHLTRWFARYFGITPGMYRRSGER
ncbi:AraC family transcriptional regulator [Pendulispora albinea]|uniref:AraC family transcriptional regulator n=1 Tax=Pendulispora albinea TaxID=2741071 RepID=A0ABZ2M984_9BACT